MNGREGLIWASAIALSLSLHLLLFVDRGSVAGVEAPNTMATTRVSFRSVSAPMSQPQDTPQQEVIEKPAPPPRPKPKQKKKVAEKARQLELPKPVPAPEPVLLPAPSTQSAEKPALQAETSSGSVEDPALLEQAKHEYLRRLIAHIESHKHYPRSARRRGIEGETKVSLRLLPGGKVEGVSVTNGHRVLRKATVQAIEDARPLPGPPESIPLPMSITFNVQFSLRED